MCVGPHFCSQFKASQPWHLLNLQLQGQRIISVFTLLCIWVGLSGQFYYRLHHNRLMRRIDISIGDNPFWKVCHDRRTRIRTFLWVSILKYNRHFYPRREIWYPNVWMVIDDYSKTRERCRWMKKASLAFVKASRRKNSLVVVYQWPLVLEKEEIWWFRRLSQLLLPFWCWLDDGNRSHLSLSD